MITETVESDIQYHTDYLHLPPSITCKEHVSRQKSGFGHHPKAIERKKKRYFCVVLRGYLNNPFTSAAMHIQPGTYPHAYDRIPWSRVPEFPGFRDYLVLRNPSLGDTDINERYYFAESAGAKK